MSSTNLVRTRWAAIGAAIAVTIGAVGFNATTNVGATTSSGERAVFRSIAPCRLMDTRPASQVGGRNTPIGASETLVVDARGAQGNCSASDLPADAVALQLNVTAVGATAPTFLAVTPDGATDSSALNPVPGAPPTPNGVTVRLDAAGDFRIFNRFGQVDVIIDVTGVHTDHDHTDLHYTKAESDDRYASRTQQLVIPGAAFGPSVVWGNDTLLPSFSRSTISGAYYTGGSIVNGLNLSAVAPVELPVGSRITSITYHYTDDSLLLLGSISFTLNRTSLSINSQAFVPDSTFATPGADPEVRSGTVTPNHVVTADETLHVSAFVRSVWPGENEDLAIKGVVIGYELP